MRKSVEVRTRVASDAARMMLEHADSLLESDEAESFDLYLAASLETQFIVQNLQMNVPEFQERGTSPQMSLYGGEDK